MSNPSSSSSSSSPPVSASHLPPSGSAAPPHVDLDLISFDEGFTSLSWDVEDISNVEDGWGDVEKGQRGRKRKESQISTPKNASPPKSSAPNKVSKMHPTKTMCVGKGKVGKKAGEKCGKKKKVVDEEDPMDDEKREERNLREKERSFKISAQISMLRDLLSSGGVAVPKGTKSSVLTEAANYIRVLQQHRFNSEIDRQNLVQKIRLMNSGQMGVKAQVAVRQAVSVNMGLQHQKPPQQQQQQHQQPSQECPPKPTSLPASKPSFPPQHPTTGMSANDYNAVFQYSLIPMAIATMGGSFLECNRRFSELSGFPRTVLSTMTIFNITSPTDLQNAFNLISKMIPTSTSSPLSPEPAILQGTLGNGESRLNCSLVKDDEGNAKYFCVQLCPTEKEREHLIMVKKKTQQHEITPYMSATG